LYGSIIGYVAIRKFLIARYWIPEYGTAENEVDFRWLLQYSPYQNIRKGVNLPAMLVTAGENDSRVDRFTLRNLLPPAK